MPARPSAGPKETPHGTGYAEALLLTAGEGVGGDFQLVLHLVPKGGAFQGFFHPLTDEGVIGDAIHAKSVGNVLEDAFWERIGPLDNIMPTFLRSSSTCTPFP